MHFNRLRLIGFKSFVDPTDVTVETGLTGIVGPNGCGKSNLVEALRWVMGESSARQMRGREMDDLIFAGSASRPQRNHAEVQLLLDNGARTAPMAFNDSAEIEVSRRIDRGSGSTYRINGRETRAKDVQLLFADEATGARSTAMVGQGEIGALISAKPAQRRSLLEEAAGITGLHSRRHEAELRLRAAETNLERLDDVMGAFETQLQGLKRQARQATRYRRIGERIRAAEALLLGRRWASAEAAVRAAEQALTEARRAVDGRTQEVAAASAAQATAAATLPPLREDEAAAGATLHRLEVAQVELEAEERRLADAQRSLESRLAQIDADVERENELSHDAAEATTQLAAERAAVSADREGEGEAESAAGTARDEATERVSNLEAEVDALTRHLAAGEARRGALNRQIEDLSVRIDRLEVQAAEVECQRAGLAAQSTQTGVLEDAEVAVVTAQAEVEVLRARVAEAEAGRVDSQTAVGAVRDTQQAAETTHAALVAEQAALTELLDGGDNDAKSDKWPALIDQINVEAGMETALGAALGDDLAASSDTKAPLHWRGLDSAGDPPPLPKGATSLADVVAAPPALTRRLSQIGVVSDDDGLRLQGALAQGQRLVSRNGGLWRWDGLTAAADAATQTATRLRQRNRLKALDGELEASEKRRAGATREIEAARAAVVAATDQESAARHALRAGEDVLAVARDGRAEAATAAAADASRLASLSETAGRLSGDLDDARQQLQTAEEARIALPADTDGRAELEGLRGRLTEGRGELAESINAYERLRREAAARGDRLAKIAADLESWQARAHGATARLAQLAERRVTAGAELDSLSD
ncbi:MAG: chromosome segregation SMC family protein, partial [Alphaproteobacteria bacterium]